MKGSATSFQEVGRTWEGKQLRSDTAHFQVFSTAEIKPKLPWQVHEARSACGLLPIGAADSPQSCEEAKKNMSHTSLVEEMISTMSFEAICLNDIYFL